jgi:hypothetical protein
MPPALSPPKPSLSGQILLSSIIPSAKPQSSVTPLELTPAQSKVLISGPVAENCPNLTNVKIASSSSSTISGTFTLSSRNWTSTQGQYSYNASSGDLNPWTNFVVTTQDQTNFNFTLIPPSNKYFTFPLDLYVKVQVMYVVNGSPVESSQCMTVSYPVLNIISTVSTMPPSPSLPAYSLSPSLAPVCPNINKIVLSTAMSSSIIGYFTLSSNNSNLWISTQGLYTYTSNSINQPWASFNASSTDLTKFNFNLTPMSGSFFTFPLNLSLKAQVVNFVNGNPVNSTFCYTDVFILNDVYPIISSSKAPSASPNNIVSYSPSPSTLNLLPTLNNWIRSPESQTNYNSTTQVMNLLLMGSIESPNIQLNGTYILIYDVKIGGTIRLEVLLLNNGNVVNTLYSVQSNTPNSNNSVYTTRTYTLSQMNGNFSIKFKSTGSSSNADIYIKNVVLYFSPTSPVSYSPSPSNMVNYSPSPYLASPSPSATRSSRLSR